MTEESSFSFGDIDPPTALPEDDFRLEDPTAKPPQDDAAERLRQLEVENEVLKRNNEFVKSYTPPPAAPVVYPPPSGQPQRTQQEIDKEIAEKMILDPAGVIRANNAAMIQEMQKAYIPIKATTARQAINFYREMHVKDPEVRKDFDKQISQYSDNDLANLDPARINEALEIVKDQASMSAIKRGYMPEEYRRSAPNYGGSGSGGSGGQPGSKGGSFQLSDSEKEYVRMGRILGTSDEELRKDILRERANPSQNIHWASKPGV